MLAQPSGKLHKFNSNDFNQQFKENEDDLSEESNQMAGIFPAAADVEAASAVNSQCERINFGLCSSMAYNFTRGENFFKDPGQVEAAERAKLFEPLVRHKCSNHLTTYLCELLAPMCVKNDSTKRFAIFPCRSFCRRVNKECGGPIDTAAPDELLLRTARAEYYQAFDCDKLPFESNGGELAPRGPCHELPDEPAPRLRELPDSYKPFNEREPSYFQDKTPIDPNLIRPVVKLAPKAAGTNQVGAGFSANQFGQQLALGLLSYSNLLCIITLICLLLVVNAKRLKRLKSYLSRRSSASSNSSSNSRRKFAGQPALVQTHKMQSSLSPSSSSRSLVLVSVDGKRGQAKNELISNTDRRTLINVNLERQREQQNSVKYHQYEYIPYQSPLSGRSQAYRSPLSEAHMKKILISSPSHQVFLSGDQMAESSAPNRPQFVQSDMSSQYANPIFSMGPPSRTATWDRVP